MIQPLRTVHRRASVLLAIVLPAMMAVGLIARHPRTQRDVLSERSRIDPAFRSDKLWQKNAIQTDFYRNSSNVQEINVVLKPTQELNEPDLLLYWAAGEEQGKELSTDAHLLGAFRADRAFTLPQDAAPGEYLVLYSGAHQAVVDTALVEKLP